MSDAFQGLFALMNRSLQTEDRSIRTHLWRFLFVVMSYAMLVAAQQSISWASAPGLNVFQSMCYLNFFCITIAGVSFFAAAVTEEKEEMTLGLLKMAGVSSLSLLIGKSTPRLIAALLLLTSQLPFTMLAITLGGVSIYQVLAAYTCLFAYLVLVANVALFFSVICQRSRAAGFLTGFFLFALLMGPLFSNTARSGLIMRNWLVEDGTFAQAWETGERWVRDLSAYGRIRQILNTGFSDSAFSFQVVSNCLLGLGFLGLGWSLFEICTRNEKPASEDRGFLTRRLGAAGSVMGAGRAWEWALGWKDFHFVGGGKMMILLKLLLYFGVVGLIIGMDKYYGMGGLTVRDVGNVALVLGLWAIVIELGIQGSRVFYTEIKWKTLSSIMLLPNSVGEIAYSKVLGAAISLLPAIVVTLFGFVLAPQSVVDVLQDTVDEPGAWYFVSQVIVFVHLATILSLYVKWGALPLAFAGIYGGNILMMFFFSIFFRFGGPPDDGFFVLMTVLAILGCVATHAIIGRRLKTLAAR